jgi:two-component system OmpR family sensor kinase
MIENLLDIEPDNEAIIFLSKRLKSQNYRGNHLVQHQRSSLNELVGVLLSIYSVVKEGKLIVPKGDPKTEDDVAVYPEYKTMVTLYQTVFNIGSYSSIKKVDFLNLARMGLLDRFDKKDKLYPTYKKAYKMNSVALSKVGIELLFNPKKADYIFTQAMDVLFNGFMSEIYELFQYKDLKGYITLDEFTLFVSYLGLTLKDESNSTTIIDIAKYIKSFRQLKKTSKQSSYRTNK